MNLQLLLLFWTYKVRQLNLGTMAVQKPSGDDTHMFMESANDIFSLHSDQTQSKARRHNQHSQKGLSGLSRKAALCIFAGVLLGLISVAASLGALAVSMYALHHSSEELVAFREWDGNEREEVDRNTLFQVNHCMVG